MTERVCVSACYYAGTTGYVDLPEGKTWSDVEDWYVKWDVLFLKFNGEDYTEFGLNSGGMDCIDWKRPTSVSIYPTLEDGTTDYDEELASN